MGLLNSHPAPAGGGGRVGYSVSKRQTAFYQTARQTRQSRRSWPLTAAGWFPAVRAGTQMDEPTAWKTKRQPKTDGSNSAPSHTKIKCVL